VRTSVEFRDAHLGKNVARLVKHEGDIFIETEGNHDGTVVFTSVRVPRAVFADAIKRVGGIF
jgi:hypothetical protein